MKIIYAIKFTNFHQESGQNRKTFSKLQIIWLGIFEINSKIISSQMIGKIFSKDADLREKKHSCFSNFFGQFQH
jgi:hypothetical protein